MIYSNEYHKKLMFDTWAYHSLMPSVHKIRTVYVFIDYSEKAMKTVKPRPINSSGLAYCLTRFESLYKVFKPYIVEDKEKDTFDVHFTHADFDWFYLPGGKHDISEYKIEELKQAIEYGEDSLKSDKDKNDKKKKDKALKKKKTKVMRKAKPVRITRQQQKQMNMDDRINSMLISSSIDTQLNDGIRRILRRGVSIKPNNAEKTADVRFISIDIGVKNFATICSNAFPPYLISGHSMVNILGHYESRYNHASYGRYSRGSHFNKAKKLEKRNELLHDYIVSICDRLIKNAEDYDINTIICGYPEVWSKKVSFETKDMTTMFQRTLAKFKEMLKKRCFKRHITFVEIDEAYTSVASFIDKDNISLMSEYGGKRVTRDKYITKSGYSIHADVNASYNIARKYLIKKNLWNDLYYAQMIALLNNSRFIAELSGSFEENIAIELEKKEMRNNARRKKF